MALNSSCESHEYQLLILVLMTFCESHHSLSLKSFELWQIRWHLRPLCDWCCSGAAAQRGCGWNGGLSHKNLLALIGTAKLMKGIQTGPSGSEHKILMNLDHAVILLSLVFHVLVLLLSPCKVSCHQICTRKLIYRASLYGLGSWPRVCRHILSRALIKTSKKKAGWIVGKLIAVKKVRFKPSIHGETFFQKSTFMTEQISPVTMQVVLSIQETSSIQ